MPQVLEPVEPRGIVVSDLPRGLLANGGTLAHLVDEAERFDLCR